MRSVALSFLILTLAFFAVGCQTPGLSGGKKKKPAGLVIRTADELTTTPLYKMSEREMSGYIGWLQESEPSLPKRVMHLARKNIGQPYELYLLGESPAEVVDPQPLYDLKKSDCVVYAEHTYAMALAPDWPTFFRTLQRIRYVDGRIGVTTRNHYTEADWTVNNEWLVRDVTAEVAGETIAEYPLTVNRKAFFKSRYALTTDYEKQKLTVTYVPLSAMDSAMPLLQDGDFVNVVVGPKDNASAYVTHVGLIGIGPDGITRDFVHSTPPEVREEPLSAYIERSLKRAAKAEHKARGKKDAKPIMHLKGFRFFRLQDDPMANLRKIDGPNAPRISMPWDAAP